MNFKNLFLIVSLSICVVGCNNEELENYFNQQNGNKTITAFFEGEAQSRTSVTDKGVFSWITGDKIGVWTGSGFTPFTLYNGENANEATFTGLVNENNTLSGYAVYPYSDNNSHTYTNEVLTINLPTEYGESSTPYISNTNAAMIAEITSVSSPMMLHFRHVGGVFRYLVKNVPVGASKFVFTAEGKNVAGDFIVTKEGDELIIKLDETQSQSGAASNTVTINFEALKEVASEMVFYIPVPTGTYGKTTIDIQKGDGTSLGKITDIPKNTTFELERRGLVLSPTKIFPSVGGTLIEDQPVTGNEEANNALEAETTNPAVSLIAAAAVSEFNLGANFTAEGTTQSQAIVNYNEGIPQNMKVVQDAYQTESTPTAAKSKGNVSVSINTDNITTTGGEEPTLESLECLTPDLTGEIETIGDKVLNITNATIHTSSTTMIFGAKVNVGTLNVKGGNVVIKGSVDEIKDGRQNKSLPIYIVKEGNATVSKELPSGFYYVSSREEAALRSAFDMANETETSTYSLRANVDITNSGNALTLAKGKKLTLNLNGKTITAANTLTGCILVNGELTLTGDGTIKASQKYSADVIGALIRVDGESAKLTMDGGTIYSAFEDPADNGHHGVGLYNGGDFTMTGGKIESGWYALAGSGNDDNTSSLIEINGGQLISTGDYAMYLPQGGTTTIKNGTVNGATGGVAIRRGTLNIEDDAQILCKNEGTTGDWSDGTGKLGNAALVVAANYGDCVVNISGGNFTAEKYASVLDNPAGGHKATINITGGTFSDPSALQYLGENADVEIKFAEGANYQSKGFVAKSGMTIDIDLNGGSYELEAPYVGSSGTETAGCQLLRGATVSFKNGTLSATAGALTLIQNYSNLTLSNMTLNPPASVDYTLSNNNGTVLIENTVINATADNQKAFDVYFWPSGGYGDGAQVTVKGEDTQINGKIEFTSDGTNAEPKHTLIIEGGTFNGEFYVQEEAYKNENLKINGGTFTDPNIISYVKSGNVTVNLKKNVTISKPMTLANDAQVTVNLGEFTITNETILAGDVDAFVVSKGKLTINGDEGGVKCHYKQENPDTWAMAVWAYNNGHVVINGGNFFNEQAKKGQLDLIYAKENAKIEITGGKFESANYSSGTDENRKYWLLNVNDANRETAHIIVTGGEFVNFNPANNFSEGDNTCFIDTEKYQVTVNGVENDQPYSGTTEVTYKVEKK